MSQSTFAICCIVLTALVAGAAMITDLKWRRIPNYLTFSGFGVALALRLIFQGWVGLGLALAGAVLAPTLLLVMHGGKGLGMGDLKLAATFGAILGPVLALVAMLVAAVTGGIQAVVIMLRPGGLLRDFIATFLIGLPFGKKLKRINDTPEVTETPAATMPYGVAIGVGSLMTMGVWLWLGK